MADEEALNLQEAPEVEDNLEETEAGEAGESAEETEDTDTSEDEEGGEKPTRKVGAEKRIAELTAKRRQAEREADYWRNEAMRKQPEPGQQSTDTFSKPKPQENDFEDYTAFVDALTDWKSEKREFERDADRTRTDQQSRSAQFQAKLNEGFEKYEDFADVAFNQAVTITQTMVDAMHDCDHAADIAYYLGQNPTEARKIASLNPLAAAREIGKLEARFDKPSPPQKKTTQAGNSIKPVGTHEGAAKREEDMSTDEWIAMRNRKERGRE